ncbi:MAG TPA: FAD-dependent oxidoreductase [Anaerolineae bacterium]|nr:FAD-dependent oxidoreductase [Anaerolineae bacterium]HQH38917.1 FAD-dependent oxidoreductase [Anaerolineae bacterium]
MADYRITAHPILPLPPDDFVAFTWQGQPLTARRGEMIASALFAHGIHVFGRHHRDGSPQGIFCANGQCSQCLVIADGLPVKACMTPVTPGMVVEPLEGLPVLPSVAEPPPLRALETIDVPVLIIGGGPAGMSAAIQLAHYGVHVLLVDDKSRLGGKLVLQTHRFFGSVDAVYAGTRGIDIAIRLENEVRRYDNIEVWLNSTALAVFSDHKVGILTSSFLLPTPQPQYVLVHPEILLVAAGAREKSLTFKGNTLPGVYGAGAFQTLVNRDLVRAAERLFIVGGGNVGLIAGYHALQAGIEVVGLVEALPECGGYKVHRDKLARFGVPIYTSHTILSANGDNHVEAVTVAQVDDCFRPIAGTEKSFACDTVLIAVGLDPVNEFTQKARDFGMTVFDAGDAQEIAEASAAMFSGKIRGLEIARALGATTDPVPDEWRCTGDILKSHPGAVIAERIPAQEEGVFPVFHCLQEIPCNPCTSVCPQQLIYIDRADIRAIPAYLGTTQGKACLGCEQCVAICPGLAITLVDYRQDAAMPTVTLPYEFLASCIAVGDRVTTLDAVGNVLGDAEVVGVRALKRHDRTVMVKLRAPKAIARYIAGMRAPELPVRTVREGQLSAPASCLPPTVYPDIVCRCERVTADEIRTLIRQGYRDVNAIKAVTRAGMGACGGKTCSALILRLFREEGVPLDAVTPNVPRPLFVEVPLGVFAGNQRISESANQRITNNELRAADYAPRITHHEPHTPYSLLPTSYSVLPTSSSDVIIVGAGSVGVPAALAMARAGLKVRLFDGAASHGQGSNKAAIGGVRATHSDPAKIRLCLRSLEIFSTWEETCGHNIEWTTGGYAFVAYREREAQTLKDLLKVQHAYGLDIDWYDRDDFLQIVPDVNPNGLLGGTFSPRDGHCSPLLAGHAFYEAAKAVGVIFHFNEPVTEVLSDETMTGRQVRGVRTAQGTYHAPVVVNAAGAWAQALGRLAGMEHPVQPDSHEAGITEPVAHFLGPMVVDTRPASGSANYYFYQLRNGQVVFCITPSPSIVGFDRRETSVFLPQIALRMVDLLPRLANLRVRRTWRGLYPMTPDGSPLVGWAREVTGYLMAIGMCGQGFMLGPGLGELLARMVTQENLSPEDREVLQVLSPYRTFAGQEALK